MPPRWTSVKNCKLVKNIQEHNSIHLFSSLCKNTEWERTRDITSWTCLSIHIERASVTSNPASPPWSRYVQVRQIVSTCRYVLYVYYFLLVTCELLPGPRYRNRSCLLPSTSFFVFFFFLTVVKRNTFNTRFYLETLVKIRCSFRWLYCFLGPLTLRNYREKPSVFYRVLSPCCRL